MSERVSRVADAVLDEWADGRISPVNSMADELRRFREVAESPRWVVQTLAAWEALGESPESVRAELERLRAVANQQAANRAAHLTTRLTPLEALENVVRKRGWNLPVTWADLSRAIEEARRAAREVL